MGKAKWFLIGGGIVLLLAGLWSAVFFIAQGGPGLGGTYGSWEEKVVREGEGFEKIVMISVVGEIFSDPEGFQFGASDENIISQLDQAERDPDVAGVIIDLDTPGGAVVASDSVYRRILDLKEIVPVVAFMEDTAASGGYYIAAGADEIVANPSTITGSIGVIMLLPNIEEASGKLGIKTEVIKSGRMKDSGSPFRGLTQEERALFQSVIDEAYNQFVEAVAKGRQLDPARVRELADGRIYTGSQAKGLDLVDHLGDLDLAFNRAKQLAETPDASLVVYGRTPGFAESILGVRQPGFGEQLIDGLGVELDPGLKYLWLP